MALLGLGLSLWMTLLFGTCVAHELIHRRDKRQAMLGHMLAGICGYPALGMEHLAHHARPGDTRLAEYPLKDESVWQFAWRRMRQNRCRTVSALARRHGTRKRKCRTWCALRAAHACRQR